MSDYVFAAKLSQLKEASGLTVRIGTKQVALFKNGEEIYALNGYCPHAGAPLGDGYFEFPRAYCPMHGWEFDVRTGECATNPNKPAACVPFRIIGDEVHVLLS